MVVILLEENAYRAGQVIFKAEITSHALHQTQGGRKIIFQKTLHIEVNMANKQN